MTETQGVGMDAFDRPRAVIPSSQAHTKAPERQECRRRRARSRQPGAEAADSWPSLPGNKTEVIQSRKVLSIVSVYPSVPCKYARALRLSQNHGQNL